MPHHQGRRSTFDHLRRRAEELLQQRSAEGSSRHSGDVSELINELEIHQAELEIQNEELKQSQQELASLHREYECLYEFAPCGYLTLSDKGIVTRANLTAVSLLGADRTTLFHSSFSQSIDPDWTGAYQAALREAERTGDKQSLELPLKSRQDRSVWVQVNIQAELDETGAVWQWRVVLDDITERKRTEEALIQAKQEAEEAQGAAEAANRHKSSFLAKMSHDIRTPMNSIIGMHRLVLAGELSAKQRERIQVAKESAESLLWLLNDLLDLSRIESGRFSLHEKEFRLRRMLQNALKEMELPAAEKGCRLDLHLDENLPASLIGDPFRLKRILINLLSNAVKFTGQGRVSLEAELLDLAPCTDEEDLLTATVLFRVSDTGAGIDSDKLEAIFETYEQADGFGDAEQGAGLGLAICRKLSQEMGGSIWAESEPGQGSVFSVQVPLKTDGRLAEEAETCAEEGDWGNIPPQRILLVEDQRMNQLFTMDLLSSQGHSVEVAEDGQQALDLLDKKSFDLVLMDIKLPVMDGIEATRRIRFADPVHVNADIPVIGLSAHVPTEDELGRYQEAGFNDYVVKPVSFEKLFAAIRELAARKGG